LNKRIFINSWEPLIFYTYFSFFMNFLKFKKSKRKIQNYSQAGNQFRCAPRTRKSRGYRRDFQPWLILRTKGYESEGGMFCSNPRPSVDTARHLPRMFFGHGALLAHVLGPASSGASSWRRNRCLVPASESSHRTPVWRLRRLVFVPCPAPGLRTKQPPAGPVYVIV
jgi:hypothetical protein